MTFGAVLAVLDSATERVDTVDVRWLAFALLLQLAHVLLRAVAWRNALAAAYPAGVALNTVVPARGGEAAKVALARAQVPGSSVATVAGASVVVLVLDAVLGLVLLLGAWAVGLAPALPAAPAPSAYALPAV